MSLVPSLLQAVIGLDGEALVIHVGEKPYVVAPSGQVELATRALTFEAVTGILEQMLPAESRHALEEFGAVEYELPPFPQLQNDHFTVVAARGGDDIWVEVRRRRMADDDSVPEELFETRQPMSPHDPVSMHPDSALSVPDAHNLWQPDPALKPAAPPRPHTPPPPPAPSVFAAPDPIEISPPQGRAAEPAKPPKVTPFPVAARATPAPIAADPPPPAAVRPTTPAGQVKSDIEEFAAQLSTMNQAQPAAARPAPPAPVVSPPLAKPQVEAPVAVAPPDMFQPVDSDAFELPAIEILDPASAAAAGGASDSEQDIELELELNGTPPAPQLTAPPPMTPAPPVVAPPQLTAPPPMAAPPPVVAPPQMAAPAQVTRQPITPAAFVPPPPPDPEPMRAPEPPPRPAPMASVPPPVVVPEPVMPRVDTPPPAPPVFDKLPVPPADAVMLPLSRVRVGDQSPDANGQAPAGLHRLLRFAVSRGASTLYLASKSRPSVRLSGEMQILDEPVLAPNDVEQLVFELLPEANRDAFHAGQNVEWVCEVADVGRVICLSFRDHRGPGAIFRMTTFRAVSAEQLGLSREIRALATETDGLVLVSGPRVSGKSTLIAAFVDLINRSRRVYLITLEREIRVVHESRASFVSQREARTDGEMLEAMRHALREEPDVIFVEELRGAEMLALALDGAASGRLIVATLPAPTSAAAIEYLVNFVRPEERREVLHGIAESLRGIVAQVLVRKPGGGHVAARELMLNSTAIAALIAEGRLSELTAAIGDEHKLGMVPLNDALAGFVKSGHVDIREAYRRAADRADFLTVLQRQGVDTSFAERPA